MDSIEKKQIAEIGHLIYVEFGIYIASDKLVNLEPKIAKLLMYEKYRDMDDLYTHLMMGDKECLDILIRYITTNHTFFFRESDHFDFILKVIKTNPQKEYKIWCAACSTGEEPYSIIMTLLDAGITNFKILASDVDRTVLQAFHIGNYNDSRLDKVTKKQKLQYFTKQSDSYYSINPKLRSYISIKALNLIEEIQFEEQFDFVLCRNVFIYFDEESRKTAINTLVNNLKVNGYLFIGHTETLFSIPSNLVKDGHSIYRKTKQ